jgi:hypothetical protein
VKLMKTRHLANHICYKVTLSLKTGIFGRWSAYKSYTKYIVKHFLYVGFFFSRTEHCRTGGIIADYAAALSFNISVVYIVLI